MDGPPPPAVQQRQNRPSRPRPVASAQVRCCLSGCLLGWCAVQTSSRDCPKLRAGPGSCRAALSRADPHSWWAGFFLPVAEEQSDVDAKIAEAESKLVEAERWCVRAVAPWLHDR